MRNLSVEVKIILLLSRQNLTDDDLDLEIAALNTQCDSIDCNKIFEIAIWNDVVPLIYKNCKDANIFPPEFETHLQLFYKKTLSENRSKSEKLLQIIKLLQDEGIEIIPLKGSFASESIFNDPGVYPSGDIDILVRKSRLLDAEKIVTIGAGYVKAAEFEDADLLANHYHFLYKKNGCLLEVHWNLVKRYFMVPTDFWWEGIRTTEWQGMQITELAIEKYLLYTIFRVFDHNFTPLKFFVLIAAIITKHEEEIDWEKLFEYAREFRMKRLTIFTLKIIHELLAAKVPLIIRQKKIIGYELIKNSVLAGLFKGVARQHFSMMVYSFLLDSPFAIMKALLCRLFPSKGELRLRYNLPGDSLKVYLYYVLNPFLLVLRKRK